MTEREQSGAKPEEPLMAQNPYATRLVPEPQQNASVVLLDEHGQALRVVALQRTSLSVGRLPISGLVLDAPTVSRAHLRVDWDGHTATVTDLESRSGTFLDQVRLPAQTPTLWRPGQVIQLGPYRLNLHYGDLPAVPAPENRVVPSKQLQAGPTKELNPARVPPDVLAAPPPPVRDDSAPTRMLSEPATTPPLKILTAGPLAVTPNQRATVNVVIVNQGDAAERYTLDVDGVAPAWVQLPSALMIGAGEQVIATIGVVVPLESTSLAQIYPITVRLLAGGGQLASRAMMEWDVQPFVDGQLVIEPKRVVNRRSAAFSVALSNLGNTAARFAIGVDEDAPDLQATLETSLVQVGPGETVTLPLKVTAPARWIGAERRHGFTVKASYAQQRPFTVAGMLVQPPMISTWLLIGLILMLLIIAALAVRLIGIAG